MHSIKSNLCRATLLSSCASGKLSPTGTGPAPLVTLLTEALQIEATDILSWKSHAHFNEELRHIHRRLPTNCNGQPFQ